MQLSVKQSSSAVRNPSAFNCLLKVFAFNLFQAAYFIRLEYVAREAKGHLKLFWPFFLFCSCS